MFEHLDSDDAGERLILERKLTCVPDDSCVQAEFACLLDGGGGEVDADIVATATVEPEPGCAAVAAADVEPRLSLPRIRVQHALELREGSLAGRIEAFGGPILLVVLVDGHAGGKCTASKPPLCAVAARAAGCESDGVRIIYSFPDAIGRPGIGTTAYNQVRELATHGADVTLYCTSLQRELPESVRVVRTLTVGGRRIPHRALGIERAYRHHDARVAAALTRRDEQVDVVHCWPRATIRTAEAARARGIPTLREVPNTHTGYAFDEVARERAALGLPAERGHSHTFDRDVLSREEREYEVADFLLVPSEYSRRTFVERNVAPEKLVLHRYGYDPERFFPGPKRNATRPFTAIFVGRCEPRKGLHYALRAWHDSGAAETGRFVVCGAFDPAYREVVAPLLAHPSVDAPGFVDDPAALMRESDVLVFPSVEEGSALVTYEAQACGCVPVVSEATGARVVDGVDGLVHAPRDVATLTAHLRDVRDDPALLGSLRTATLESSRGLTWWAAGEELLRLYADAATAGRTAVAARRVER
jgi:glycosyltransferase involved in cell wall biosynthesis